MKHNRRQYDSSTPHDLALMALERLDSHEELDATRFASLTQGQARTEKAVYGLYLVCVVVGFLIAHPTIISSLAGQDAKAETNLIHRN